MATGFVNGKGRKEIQSLNPSGANSYEAVLIDGIGDVKKFDLDSSAPLQFKQDIEELAEHFQNFATRESLYAMAPPGIGVRIKSNPDGTISLDKGQKGNQNGYIDNISTMEKENVAWLYTAYKAAERVTTYDVSTISDDLNKIDSAIYNVKIGQERHSVDALQTVKDLEQQRISGDIDDEQFRSAVDEKLADIKQTLRDLADQCPTIRALKEPQKETGYAAMMSTIREPRDTTANFYRVEVGLTELEVAAIATAKGLSQEEVFDKFRGVVKEWAQTYVTPHGEKSLDGGIQCQRSCMVSDVQLNGVMPHIHVEVSSTAIYKDGLTGIHGIVGYDDKQLNYDIKGRLSAMLDKELGVTIEKGINAEMFNRVNANPMPVIPPTPQAPRNINEQLANAGIAAPNRPQDRILALQALDATAMANFAAAELKGTQQTIAELTKQLVAAQAKEAAELKTLELTGKLREAQVNLDSVNAAAEYFEKHKPTLDAAVVAVETLQQHEVFADMSPDELLADLPQVTIKAIEDAAEATTARDAMYEQLTEANEHLNAVALPPEVKETLLSQDSVAGKINVVAGAYLDIAQEHGELKQDNAKLETLLHDVAVDKEAFSDLDTLSDKVDHIIAEKDQTIAEKDVALKTAEQQVAVASVAMHDMQKQMALVHEQMALLEKEAALLRAKIETDHKAQAELVEKLPAVAPALGLTKNDIEEVSKASAINPLDGFDTFVQYAEMAAERRNNDFDSVKNAINDIGKDFGYQYDDSKKAAINASQFKEAVTEEMGQLRNTVETQASKQDKMTQHLRELRDGIQNAFGEQLAAIGLTANDIIKDPKTLTGVSVEAPKAQEAAPELKPWEKAAQTPLKKQETPKRGDEPAPDDDHGPKM